MTTVDGAAPTRWRRYVAMGDSTVAAPFLGRHRGPVGCGRSTGGWPHRVAAALGIDDLVDVSCTSAASRHLLAPQRTVQQGVYLGTNPAQIDMLTPDTDLVTVSIGANDVGFIEAVDGCRTDRWGRSGRPQAGIEVLTGDGVDRFAQAIADAHGPVTEAFAAVRSMAPKAQILAVGYPSYFPSDPSGYPQVEPLRPVDAAYLRDRFAELNDMMALSAHEAGLGFVDAAMATAGHDMYQPVGEAWVNGFHWFRGRGRRRHGGAPLHPNRLGMPVIADAVVAAIVSGSGQLPGTAAGGAPLGT